MRCGRAARMFGIAMEGAPLRRRWVRLWRGERWNIRRVAGTPEQRWGEGDGLQ